MNLEQTITEHAARRTRRRRVIARQSELSFPGEPFRLTGETLAAGFAKMRETLTGNEKPAPDSPLLPM